jgi:phosphoribosylaminoimidazole-succinocarboxamide synthase
MGPKPLPDHVITVVSNLYAAGANAYTGYDLFDVPDLSAVLERLDDL